MPTTVCTSCNGKKGHDEMGERPCQYCAGTGRNTRSNLFHAPCNKCNGSGMKAYCEFVKCTTCNGRGKIDY